MKTNKDIFHAELKNLYALEKQILNAYSSVKKNVTNKNVKDFVSELEKYASSDLTFIHSYLKKKKINSGNTVDQIVKEITKNLKQISQADYPKEIVDLGILTSLIRLNSYKSACYEVTLRMAKLTDADKKVIEQFKAKRERNEDFAKKAKKIIKKEF